VVTIKKNIDEGRDNAKRKTIFHQLLSPKATEGHVVRNVEDLTDEAFTILSAAADTTGHAMTTTTYYIVSNANVYHTLAAELKSAFPDPAVKLDFLTLEKLPYLTAVIKEGLRLSFGVPGRLPRMIEKDGAVFNGYPVPRGTIVGMSSWLMHRDPNVFQNPDSFEPARWLDPATIGKLEKNLVAFGRGSRQCIGMQYVLHPTLYEIQSVWSTCIADLHVWLVLHQSRDADLQCSLAYCEIYVTLGTIFRRFENLRVCETTPAEVLEFDDWFGPYIAKGARPLQVAVDD
jgi:cytochrome P450